MTDRSKQEEGGGGVVKFKTPTVFLFVNIMIVYINYFCKPKMNLNEQSLTAHNYMANALGVLFPVARMFAILSDS